MESPSKEFQTPTKKKIFQSPSTPQTPTVDDTVKRRVSDLLVTLHKCVQTWETDNKASFNTANTLCNLYNQWNSVQECESVPQINEICKRKYYVKLAETREDLLHQLTQQKLKLNALIKKMTELVNNLQAVHYLGLVSHNINNSSVLDVSGSSLDDTNGEIAVFATWDAKRFYYTSRKLVDMYSKEYFLKAGLYDHFFNYRVADPNGYENDNDEKALGQCISVWLHQPYIDKSSQILLDSMLIEAGLK